MTYSNSIGNSRQFTYKRFLGVDFDFIGANYHFPHFWS